MTKKKFTLRFENCWVYLSIFCWLLTLGIGWSTFYNFKLNPNWSLTAIWFCVSYAFLILSVFISKLFWNNIKLSFENSFEEFKKNNHQKLVFIGTAFVFYLATYFLFFSTINLMSFLEPVLNILKRNFGDRVISNSLAILFLTGTFFGIIFYSYFLICIATWSGKEVFKSKFVRLLLTISAITLIFLVGVVFIDGIFGVQKYTYKLHAENKSVVATLNCGDDRGNLIVGHNIRCRIEDNQFSYINYSAKLKFSLFNGSRYETNFTNIEYIAPVGVSHMDVEINVLKDFNETIKLRSGYDVDYLTIDEFNSNKKEFLTYFLGLLLLCFVTVPIGIKNVLEVIYK